ncbi:hypothetical protein RRU94_03310 [Domibacillus sp. DTU_2020_1001157_1_SI_ALB_TIR_016]|uniref:hypothetical protein n=1 Tax=Domibacillus sp. DTU_2020_1001157_1_SI_ALB_TIR_016 TaxID=3077789 RepID=UPI0028E7CD30|nr:hypothetical protein [Domibacillus sp. DTU_2020_1001157_1_SI_ALB_TIR_016]WNS78982.1 hypothetical protein RRU94_03310 [Domibacillus sp. DTU_2020_1001157_1_SI_ALB_TIR_016]
MFYHKTKPWPIKYFRKTANDNKKGIKKKKAANKYGNAKRFAPTFNLPFYMITIARTLFFVTNPTVPLSDT